MSFDREDFYEECKSYCEFYELLDLVDNLIFDSDYNSYIDKSSMIKLKGYVIGVLEEYEKKRVGWVLKD